MKLIYLLLILTTMGCSMFGIRTEKEPNYEVITSDDNKQIRKFNPMITASVIIKGDYKNNASPGFKQLAGFIFGDNETNTKVKMTAPVIQRPSGSEKISMTAPVIQTPGDDAWEMSFVMPAEYTLDSLPKPKNPNIIIKQIPSQTVAVLSYTGLTDENKINKLGAELTEWIIQQGYKNISKPRSARFDPPWTIPFLRRNEIHITVEKK